MIGRIFFGLVDAGFAVLEAGARTVQRVKRIGRALLGRNEPVPLTRRSGSRSKG